MASETRRTEAREEAAPQSMIVSDRDPSRWEGHYLGALYIKTAKEALRAVAIGATASHIFSAGLYRSTELRKPLLWPPTA